MRALPVSLAVSLLFTLSRAASAQTNPATPAPPPPPAGAPAPAAPAPAAPPTVTAPAGVTAPPPPAPTVVPAPPPPPALAPAPVVVLPPPPPAAPAPGASGPEVTTLRLLRDKGIISQAEYDSTVHDIAETSGQKAPTENTAVIGKWSTTFYGFIESDYIYDTTRSFNDFTGAGSVARAESQAGKNPRFTMGVRNSRFGFKMRAPETGGIRTSAQLEMDFLGTQLPVSQPNPAPSPNPAGSEGAYFTNPTARIRHANLKIETPIVDILAGQYWALFGWGSAYQPNTVEIQGVPGEIYVRTPQLRISKTIKADPITFEIGVAATRPVQRDSGTPDGQAGLRLSLDSWTGVQTTGSTGTQIAPLSIAASGMLRHVAVDNWAPSSTWTNDKTMGAFALDGFLPVIPGTKDDKDNSLSLQGEFSTGSGFADMFTGFTGGVAIVPPPGLAAGKTYSADIDNGIVAYLPNATLHPVQWTTYLIGAQYYVPGTNGHFWVSGNYSHTSSSNSWQFALAPTNGPSTVRAAEDWFDVNVFVDPINAVRVGAEYANFNDMYVDGHHAINHRFQLSGFYIF